MHVDGLFGLVDISSPEQMGSFLITLVTNSSFSSLRPAGKRKKRQSVLSRSSQQWSTQAVEEAGQKWKL